MSRWSWLLVGTMVLGGCAQAPGALRGEAAPASAQALDTAGPMPRLPWAGGSGSQQPWGGSDSSRWRPEAKLANAASEALNDAWATPNVQDAVVAVPTRLYSSDFHPYNDGQSNAAVSFESWQGPRPPVVATLLRFANRAPQVVFRLDRTLPGAGAAFDVSYQAQGAWHTVSLTTGKTAAGDYTTRWDAPAELGWTSPFSGSVVLVHPHGWDDWFPVWFRMPVRTIPDLLSSVPAAKRTFADGASILDHEHVSLQGARRVQHLDDGDQVEASSLAALAQGMDTPFERLLGLAQRHGFSAAYNQDPFQPDNVHASFPYGGRNVVTSVGRGWTWVASQPAAPFKILYTAFERRQPQAEASAPDGGVPSGGGWHAIGDPAETILNDLENAPIVVGSATHKPLLQPPSGHFAHGLSDVATIRWLRPGEAFMTRRGQGEQVNYHWFCFQQDREVCTEEWVHPTVPDDQFKFQ